MASCLRWCLPPNHLVKWNTTKYPLKGNSSRFSRGGSGVLWSPPPGPKQKHSNAHNPRRRAEPKPSFQESPFERPAFWVTHIKLQHIPRETRSVGHFHHLSCFWFLRRWVFLIRPRMGFPFPVCPVGCSSLSAGTTKAILGVTRLDL